MIGGMEVYLIAEKAKKVMQKFDIFQNYPSDYEVIMQHLPNVISIVEELESMAVLCRKVIAGYQKELPYYPGLSDKVNIVKEKNFLSKLNKNVTVRLENNILILQLFPLIKNISSKTKEYISRLVSDAIKSYFLDHEKPDFTDNCVIVIHSKYASPALIRDNDSVEVSTIINVLKAYFLPDDDGMRLSIYRIGSLSNRHETEVYLMKQEDFLLWFEQNMVHVKENFDFK